jgi:tripartite-type tricarboxylate transporter receptor subunit TctC
MFKPMLSSAVLAFVFAGTVLAQDYPGKAIRVVTTPPGGGSDLHARMIAHGLAAVFSQPVVVDNRQVNILGELVAKAPPDGYTLLVDGGILWLTPLVQKTGYDPIKDLAPITMLSTQPNLLVLHPSVNAKSVQELIALARAKPGVLAYGTTGVGGSNYLAGELFKTLAGVNILGVNYKAPGILVTSLVGGELQIGFLSSASVSQHVKSGALKAIAITSAKPSVLFPDLPTIAASGLPGYQIENRTAMFAPAKTPADVIERLNREAVRLVNSPEGKAFFANSGLEGIGSTPQELTADIQDDMTLFGKVVRDAGLHPQ